MRAEKQFLLDELQEKLDSSIGFIVTRYQGFTANKARQFRDIVSEQQGEYEVVRKRVFFKALEKNGIPFNMDNIEGHIGVIFAKKDVAQLTKACVKYGEENEKALEVLGGKIEGDLYSAQDMIAIASLPSLNELRAQILGLLEAPARDIVSVCNAHLSGLVNCLDAKAKKEQ